jgi:cell fate (sporulation/competence/biofilm development) regulator YlbF (YheA/YmcA/DUF963 family)
VSPYDKAHELACEIQASEQFKELQDVRARIEQTPSQLQVLQDFRQRQWELQTKQLRDENISEQETLDFQKLSEVVGMNADVSKYLELEYYLNRVLMDIYGILSKAVADAAFPFPWETPSTEGAY